jgi:hypothetical protein
MEDKTADRFWAKVDVGSPEECWPWKTDYAHNKGYGLFSIKGKNVKAHRYSFFIHNHYWPPVVIQECDNRACVNPAHLIAGTRALVSSNNIKKGKHAQANKTHCPQGHKYSESNTGVYGDRRRRRCRTCARLRYVPKHKNREDQMTNTTKSDRFWAKVDVRSPEECWVWTASRSKPSGYGRFNAGEKKYASAHRYSYFIHNGAIPDGMYVCHTCDNPPCVNPNHLWLGTPSENTLDMFRKGRKPPRKKGYKHKTQQFCKNGHERTPENTYVHTRPDGNSIRHCRICRKQSRKAYAQKNK